jgi:lysozyme
VQLVKRFEGLQLTAYLDPAGVPTIGWGHTANVSMGPPPQRISEDQAETMLAFDLVAAGEGVTASLAVAVTQGQFDALTDFAFNEGVEALEGSTLMRLLNDGDVTGAAAQFASWVYGDVGGQMVALPGLVVRRAAEEAMFLGVA